MKGMSITQYAEVVKFAQEHHAFAMWSSDEEKKERQKKYPKLDEYGFNIKYIDSVYDSRTSDVWVVKFRSGGTGYRFSTNHFAMREKPKHWKYDNLFDLCMAYLKGEFKPKEEFYFDDRKKHNN